MRSLYPPQLLALAPFAVLAPSSLIAADALVQLDRFNGPASSSEIVAFDPTSKLLYNPTDPKATAASRSSKPPIPPRSPSLARST